MSCLNERRVDGAIILSAIINDKLLLRVAGTQFPIVVMDRELEGEYIYNVLLDNVQFHVEELAFYINGKKTKKI